MNRLSTLMLIACVGLFFGANFPQELAAKEDKAKVEKETEKSETKDAEKAQAKEKDDKEQGQEKEEKEAKKKDEKKNESEKKDSKAKKPKKKRSTKAKKEDAKEGPPKTEVRLLALSGYYVDKVEPAGIDPFSLAMGAGPVRQKSFYRLCDYLEELGKDEDVKYVVFDLSSSVSMNQAQLDEMTRRLKTLKATGKKMIAWLENASAIHVTLAASCDEVILADFGGIDLPSLAMQAIYYKDAMDLVGVKASVVRAGDYKGAVEPYTEPAMSGHLREHYRKMLETMNEARVNRIAKGRGLTNADVREIQKARFLTPKEALSKGLVDKLAPYGSMKKTINDLIGEETEWTKPARKKKKDISFFELMSIMMSGPKTKSSRTKDDSIAVLHLNGAIVNGKSRSPGNIVSGPTVSEIEKLISNEKIKGVVVRVNSPGGSATASEAVRQALQKLSKKKPTVISMGDMAASGGYWISSIGVPIYAERGTLTGSIGVFSMKLSFGSLMRRVGLSFETIALDDSAAAFAMDRPWADGDVKTLKKSIDMVYKRFLKLVSKSRKMPVEKIEPLAGGRVWSGSQAKRIGLVDEIGGLDDCLALVAKKAKLENYKTTHVPTGRAGISLLELLGEQNEDEISVRVRQLFKMLRGRGFSLNPTQALIDDGIRHTEGLPTIWLLSPAEFSIR